MVIPYFYEIRWLKSCRGYLTHPLVFLRIEASLQEHKTVTVADEQPIEEPIHLHGLNEGIILVIQPTKMTHHIVHRWLIDIFWNGLG